MLGHTFVSCVSFLFVLDSGATWCMCLFSFSIFCTCLFSMVGDALVMPPRLKLASYVGGIFFAACIAAWIVFIKTERHVLQANFVTPTTTWEAIMLGRLGQWNARHEPET